MHSFKKYLLVILPLLFFLVVPTALGAETGTTMDETMFNVINIIQPILKMLYIIMRPILVVAGSALDNTFVYGEFIHLDTSLWQIWNVMKNFANYALGFFVIIQIFKFVFRDGEAKKVRDVILKALLAGIGIQMSWFALGAVIDISTILIYGVGGLPMTLMKEMDIGDRPMLGVKTHMNLSDMKSENSIEDSYAMYYTRGEYNFSPCKEVKGYIVGPQFSDQTFSEGSLTFNSHRCVYQNHLMIRTAGKTEDGDKPLTYLQQTIADEEGTVLSTGAKVAQIESALKYQLQDPEEASNTSENVSIPENIDNKLKGIVYVGYTPEDPKAKGYDINDRSFNDFVNTFDVIQLADMQDAGGAHEWQVLFNKKCTEEYNVNNGGCFYGKGTYLGNLLEDSKGFVGPLVTLYTSLLNFSDLHVTSVGGGDGRTTYASFFEFLLKAVSAVVIILPLIAMAVVFIVRIGYLWLIIALSPVLLLLRVFKEVGDKAGNKAPGKLGDLFDWKKVLGLIFSPVICVFALSVSLLFLTTLQSAFHGQEHAKVWKGLGITVEEVRNTNNTENCLSIFGLFETCYDVGSEHTGGGFYIDLFAWLIMNGFGVALVRMLLRAALKQNSFSEKMVGSMKELSGKALGSIPIIPTPQGAVSAGGLGKLVGTPGRRGELYNMANSGLQKRIDTDAKELQRDLNMSDDEGKAWKKAADKIKGGGDIDAISSAYNDNVKDDANKRDFLKYGDVNQTITDLNAETYKDDNLTQQEQQHLLTESIKGNLAAGGAEHAQNLHQFYQNHGELASSVFEKEFDGDEKMMGDDKKIVRENGEYVFYEKDSDGNWKEMTATSQSEKKDTESETFDAEDIAKNMESSFDYKNTEGFDQDNATHWKSVHEQVKSDATKKTAVEDAFKQYVENETFTQKADLDAFIKEINKTGIEISDLSEKEVDGTTYKIQRDDTSKKYTVEEKA